MKRFGKTLAMLFVLAVLSVLPAQTVFAANAPGNVKKLKVQAVTDTSAKLTWSKASRATGYIVYRVNEETGALKKVGKTDKTSCIINKLKLDREYMFQVRAYRQVKKKTYYSEEDSPAATITMELMTPGRVKNLRVGSYGNKSAYLKWDEAKNATGYAIYRYNESTEKYKRIARTKDTSYMAKKLSVGETYKFKVAAYRSVQGQTAYGAESKVVKAKGRKVDISRIKGRLFSAVMKSTGKAKVVETGRTITISAGTKIAATSQSQGEITAYLMKDGTKIKIKGSYLSTGNLHTTRNLYTKDQKEAFVNVKGYSSPSQYLIWINQYTLTVTIFKGSKGEWKQIMSDPCVVGAYGHTGVGVYSIKKKTTHYGGPCIFFTWSTRLGSGNAFHKRLDGNTQAPVSGGCVRLGDGILNFINANCPIGTTVVSY